MGDTRIHGPMAEGASQTLPDGEPMAMRAIGTRLQNASGQATRDDVGPVAVGQAWVLLLMIVDLFWWWD